MIWFILFWSGVILMLYSYVFFPLLLKFFASGKSNNKIIYNIEDGLPYVSVIISAHNEESVIAEKINSLLHSDYPEEKVEILIGSDGSTDQTNEIIRSLQKENKRIQLFEYRERMGKAHVLNQLSRHSKHSVFILTDANVMFAKETIYQLVKHFKNTGIAQVDGNIINPYSKKDGISMQEKTYLEYEKAIKYREGIIWGTTMGAFGGCYAIRADHFPVIPSNFFMEDFFISMHVLSKGGKAVKEMQAKCFEDVSDIPSEEFRRKVRISVGNWQNLGVYAKLLFPPWSAVAFCFFSHKIIRWCGPFLMILVLISNLLLLEKEITVSPIYYLIMVFMLLLFISPIADLLMKSININLKIIRFASHFFMMNLALVAGLFKYIKGVKSGAWQPTKRNQ